MGLILHSVTTTLTLFIQLVKVMVLFVVYIVIEIINCKLSCQKIPIIVPVADSSGFRRFN